MGKIITRKDIDRILSENEKEGEVFIAHKEWNPILITGYSKYLYYDYDGNSLILRFNNLSLKSKDECGFNFLLYMFNVPSDKELEEDKEAIIIKELADKEYDKAMSELECCNDKKGDD